MPMSQNDMNFNINDIYRKLNNYNLHADIIESCWQNERGAVELVRIGGSSEEIQA